MEWLSEFPIPAAGTMSAAIGAVLYLVRRGDSNLREDIKELVKQRDRAWEEVDTLREINERLLLEASDRIRERLSMVEEKKEMQDRLDDQEE